MTTDTLMAFLSGRGSELHRNLFVSETLLVPAGLLDMTHVLHTRKGLPFLACEGAGTQTTSYIEKVKL